MELNASERDFYEETMNFHPDPDPRVIESEDELKEDLARRDALENAEQNKTANEYCKDGKYDLLEVKFRNMDLHGWDLSDLDLYKATFENCNLNGAVMNNCKADHLAFYDCDIRGLRLTNSMIVHFYGNTEWYLIIGTMKWKLVCFILSVSWRTRE